MEAPEPSARYVFSGRPLYRRHNAVYRVLEFLDPGLVLDVGAASGGVCSLVVRYSPESRVTAFEPFPGNWPHLDSRVAELPQVTVDRRAASDVGGTGRLFVSTVVAGDEKGWESLAGYSSAGALVAESDSRFERSIEVETVRLDSLYAEPVRFLKIDVQGAELAVLRGASALLDRGLIDFMWVEFAGELDLLDFIRSHGFEVFDSQYLLIPRSDPPDETEWLIDGTINLSNGKTAFLAWPREYPRSDAAYCEWLRSHQAGFTIQTDLTFVRADFMTAFLTAAAAAAAMPA